jgi:hypothetical protein
MPAPRRRRPCFPGVTLLAVLMSLLVIGCGPSGVGTIKGNGGTAGLFPTRAGRPLKTAAPPTAQTKLAPAPHRSR